MNSIDDVRNVIQNLLDDKEQTSYKINKATGVSYGGLSELRNGKRKIDNLTIETAEKLYNYAKENQP